MLIGSQLLTILISVSEHSQDEPPVMHIFVIVTHVSNVSPLA